MIKVIHAVVLALLVGMLPFCGQNSVEPPNQQNDPPPDSTEILLPYNVSDSLPPDPPDNLPYGEIAFIKADDERALCILNLDTGEMSTDTACCGGVVVWSPDGEKIAFASTEGKEVAQIYVMNADGSGKRVVTLMEYNGRIMPHIDGGWGPAWSPDGKRIVFTRCMNCEASRNAEIFIIDLDTTQGVNEVRLTHNSSWDSVEDWSPDGKKILFSSETNLDGSRDSKWKFYTMNVDGSDKQLLIPYEGTGASALRFSPDGKYIAFIGWRDSQDIFLMNADGTNIRRITKNDIVEHYLSWSSDGHRLAFYIGSVFTGGDVYIINTSGNNLSQVTSGQEKYYYPEWRPMLQH